MYILEVARGCPDEKNGQLGIFELDQAKALSALGHDVVLLSLDVRSIRRWRRWGIYTDERDGIPVYHFDFPVGALDGLCCLVREIGFGMLYKKIESSLGKPDIVHVHFGDVAESVVKLCVEKNIPCVVTEHSSSVNKAVLTDKYKKKLVKTYSSASALIAVSGALRDRIKEHTGIEATIIPNIADLSMFSEEPKDKKTGLNFISAANLLPGKGFDVLLKAFREVLDHRPDSRLMIMGDGPERERLEELAEKYGLVASVAMYGSYRRDDFSTELLKSDVFVLPSRGETFGLVYVEAMACGLPVIATRCGGPEDFVDESCGALVPVDDADALAETMLDVGERLADFDGKRISAIVHERFSPRTVAKQLERVMENAAGK